VLIFLAAHELLDFVDAVLVHRAFPPLGVTVRLIVGIATLTILIKKPNLARFFIDFKHKFHSITGFTAITADIPEKYLESTAAA